MLANSKHAHWCSTSAVPLLKNDLFFCTIAKWKLVLSHQMQESYSSNSWWGFLFECKLKLSVGSDCSLKRKENVNMPIYGVVSFMGKDTINVYTITMLRVLQKEENAYNLCLQIIYLVLVVAESLHLFVGCQFFSYLPAVSYLCPECHFLNLLKRTAGKKESYLSLLITNAHCPTKVHLTLFFIRLANMDTAIYIKSGEVWKFYPLSLG